MNNRVIQGRLNKLVSIKITILLYGTAGLIQILQSLLIIWKTYTVVLEAETYGIMMTASTTYAVSNRERPEEFTAELESKNFVNC